MIPLHLRIAGFLSYRDPVDLDFTQFELACISGPNGAGKSTLLDAITWVLFGQARKRDDSLVNLQSRAAEVTLTFRYEQNTYRVQRSLVRGKTPILEFQVLQPAASPAPGNDGTGEQIEANGTWRPLTERTLRETQTRIEQTLRLDYDTFVNASFFLQGKADQFTQQAPGKRKDVLSIILGMEQWETYKAQAAERRRSLEAELGLIEGRLGEIGAELNEELPRRQRLAELESDLGHLASARRSQESVLENLRKAQAALDGQKQLVASLESTLSQSQLQRSALQDRLADRHSAREGHAALAQRAPEIEAAYRSWKRTVQHLAEWDKLALSLREGERQRSPIVEKIAAEQARLQAEQAQLLVQKQQVEDRASALANVETQLQTARASLAQAEVRVADRNRLQAEYSSTREAAATLKAENEVLRVEMDRLKGRLEALRSASGAVCPLCGQPLSPEHRESTLQQLEAEGKDRGDRFRSNKSTAEVRELVRSRLEAELAPLASAEDERLAQSQSVVQLSERLLGLQALKKDWDSTGSRRFDELTRQLENNDYAADQRKKLAEVDKQLLQLGYDAAAHDVTRVAELDQRYADEDYRRLETARAALAPLENEIQNTEGEIKKLEAQIARQEADLTQATSALEASSAALPDVDAAERSLFDLKEQENLLNQQVGAARQRVAVLADLHLRSKDLASTRQTLALGISRHKVLERAFGKDGVPALLIEQALPEIEAKANDVLDRLSDGQMSVRFMTQAGYKNKKREDLKETLDIQISDGAGPRDYEMYSGGEAFRVDFAVRVALSEVLAGRKGARLQTLVIDEGFASQDSQGRQRLIEAINLVRKDFAKILLITHLDELKDAFPARIEVEKTDRGSVLRVS